MATRFQLGTISTQAAPAGVVQAFAGSAAPTGWLLCNGAAVSRTVYAALFAAIASAHGSADGSTTFNLPDYRGRMIRGVDGGIARDPDRAGRTAAASGGNTGDNVGSVQVQATKTPGSAFTTASQALASGSATSSGIDHTHGTGNGTYPNFAVLVGSPTAQVAGGAASANINNWLSATGGASQYLHTHPVTGTCPASTVNGGGDNETRPINAYVNYIIKV